MGNAEEKWEKKGWKLGKIEIKLKRKEENEMCKVKNDWKKLRTNHAGKKSGKVTLPPPPRKFPCYTPANSHYRSQVQTAVLKIHLNSILVYFYV